jgi:hypothetical protein
MKLLTPAQWNAKTNEEKAAHFQHETVEVQQRTLMNPHAKIGSPPEEKLTTWYQAVCGGVIVSTWRRTEQQALEDAGKNIAYNLQLLQPQPVDNQLTIEG